jgi:hypothetical protein
MRATALHHLLAGASQAIGKRCRGRIVEFMPEPERNFESSEHEGRTATDRAGLEIGDR